VRSLTEFFTFKLVKGIEIKNALAAEGKTPEEIQQNLGETFKLEGDKLKYFLNCMDVAATNREKLAAVKVVQFGEGESIPPKAVLIEEIHYIPEFEKAPLAPVLKKPDKGGKQGKGKKKDGPRSSPWGLSPEELAAKKGGKKSTTENK